MAERGGPSLLSGVHFQFQVVVCNLVTMIYDKARKYSDPICSIRIEAPTSVNDVVVTKQSGARIFQSVKENIKKENKLTSKWGQMWKAIWNQRGENNFNPDTDLIQIIFPVKDPLRSRIEKTTKRASEYGNAGELKNHLPADCVRLFNSLSQMLGITQEQTLTMLKAVRVRYLGDSELLEKSLMGLLSPLFPNDFESAVKLVDSLVHLASKGGKTRQMFDFDFLVREFRKRGEDISCVLRGAFKLISQIPGKTTRRDVQRFFRGFEADWTIVRDEIPVKRDIYFVKHRGKILREAEQRRKGLRCYVIIGPKGVGKNTVAKQIAFDLACHEYLVAWLDTYPLRLNGSLISEFKRLAFNKERVHLFARLELSRTGSRSLTDVEHTLGGLYTFLQGLGKDPRLSLYLTIDSNHYELLRDDLETILNSAPQLVTVPLNLNSNEVGILIEKLRFWGALGRLEGRPDYKIRRVFERKAHRILLAALIEATCGTDETENFHSILRREYNALPVGARLAYPLVALGHMYNVETPYSLFYAAMKVLLGNDRCTEIEHFATLFLDVLLRRGETIVTRHALIASTLCEALASPVASGSPPEDTLWMPLITAILKAIDETDSDHLIYLREFAANKAVWILRQNLAHLANQLLERKFSNLECESIGLLINSIARTYQGDCDLANAIRWAQVSRDKIWPSSSNNADVILAYCYLATQNGRLALKIAEKLATNLQNPWRLLHAVRIICRAGEVSKARDILESHTEDIRKLPGYGAVRGEVLNANVGYEACDESDTPWTHARWVHNRLLLGQIGDQEAVERLNSILEQEPNVHRAFADSCHLLFIKQKCDDVIRLCDRILSATTTKSQSNDEEPTLVNPKLTQSMALATEAWAIFLRDGKRAMDRVKMLFRRSRELKKDNVWCLNWYGLFLHATESESGIAEDILRKAMRQDKNIPPLYRNLAGVILDTNVRPFSRQHNGNAIEFCRKGIDLCPSESYWNWNGLRVQLETLQYCAMSFEEQDLPDQVDLSCGIGVAQEALGMDWWA